MDNPTYNQLTPEEQYVIEAKGTEPPFTGEYDNFAEGATPSFIDPQTSLTLIVVGLHLIKRYQEP